MKHKKFILPIIMFAVLLLGVFCVSADELTSCSDPDLVYLYNFNEGNGSLLTDSCGNSNGVINGGTWVTGKYNSGLFFDSSNLDYIEINNTSFLDWGSSDINYSFSSWVNIPSSMEELPISFILDKFDIDIGHDVSLQYEGQGIISFYVSDSSEPDVYLYSINDTLDDGNWHYLVAVKEGDDYKFYIDGNLQGNQTLSGENASSYNKSFFIGISAELDFSFNGTIDEISFWKKALTQEEILELYSDTVPPVEEEVFEDVTSNPIYQIMNSAGAGLGIFIQLLAQALPLLLIGLAFVGVLIVIGMALKKVLIKGGSM
jgi:hypothetical protein